MACRPMADSELRDELPGQRWDKGLQAVIPVRVSVIDGRRRVVAIERARFDRITGLAAFEVVADVLLATTCRRGNGRGDRAAIVLSVLKGAGLPTHGV